MTKKSIFFLLLILHFTFSILHCNLLEVALDGSHPYTSIQSAIDASVPGDMVLVYPGRYYENIDFNGKCGVTLTSLEMSTGDYSYVHSTIIDGNQSGSCFKIVNQEQNLTIRGFTVTNGSGTWYYNNIYTAGGAFYIDNYYEDESNISVNLINLIIKKNKADGGGGIQVFSSGYRAPELNLSGVSIHDNYAGVCGAFFTYGNVTMNFNQENLCSFYNNIAGGYMDILISKNYYDVYLFADTLTAQSPNDFFYYFLPNDSGEGNMYVSHQNYFLTEVNSDFYVATNGDDNNSGTTSDQPLRTIQRAMQRIASDQENPKNVYIAAGTYSHELNGQYFALSGKSYVNVIGENSENTIIVNDYIRTDLVSRRIADFSISNLTFINLPLFYKDAFQSHIVNDNKKLTIKNIVYNSPAEIRNGFIISRGEVEVENLTLENISVSSSAFDAWSKSIKVRNSVFRNIQSRIFDYSGYPGGSIWADSSAFIENCIFSNCNNYAVDDMLGAYRSFDFEMPLTIQDYEDRHFIINNCLFSNNYSADDAVMNFISFYPDQPMTINNCTFADNQGGEAVIVAVNSKFTNCIIDNPESEYEVAMYHFDDPSTVEFNYCTMPGATERIFNEDNFNTLIWGEGNIDAYPQFVGGDWSTPEAYKLAENSPCINTGIPDTTGMHLFPLDLAGCTRVWDDRIDMGCYEYGSVDSDEELIIPSESAILYNYPNPFSFNHTRSNYGTTIKFCPPEMGLAEIEIYNMKGQKVKTVFQRDVLPRELEVIWECNDERGYQVSSGIYFAIMKLNGKLVASRKMLLLK